MAGHRLVQQGRWLDGRRRAIRGYTYLGLLFAVALAGAALARHAQDAQGALQRERERELIFRGEEIRRAIESYVRYTPAGKPRWPRQLDDLLRDTRGPVPRHHLRRLYTDPFTRTADWEPIPAPDDPLGIAGVRSRATTVPMTRPAAYHRASERHDCVCHWQFVARIGSSP